MSAPLGISELVRIVGDENIQVQNLAHNLSDARQLKDCCKLTFTTSKEHGQKLMKQAAGIDSNLVALILWMPADKLPKREESK